MSTAQPSLSIVLDAVQPDSSAALAPEPALTLLSSDISGFTRLTERLGDLGAFRVVEEHHAIVREVTARHAGREVELRGDGFLFAFASGRAALACAFDLQAAFAERNRDTDESLWIRIALHAGRPLCVERRLFGRAVIEVFRLTDFARPGEIVASAAAAVGMNDVDGIGLEDLGDVPLKGFRTSHRVFRVSRSAPSILRDGRPLAPEHLCCV